MAMARSGSTGRVLVWCGLSHQGTLEQGGVAGLLTPGVVRGAAAGTIGCAADAAPGGGIWGACLHPPVEAFFVGGHAHEG